MIRSPASDGRASGTHAVAVIGGGISGLAAAHELHRSAPRSGVALDLRLFEAAPRLGGQIRTERIKGMLLECGPDSLVAHKPAGEKLCRRLGLASELIRVPAGSGTLQLAHRGELYHLPAGFMLMAPSRLGALLASPLFSWRGKLRIAWERFVPRRATSGDESLSSFVTRRFGREAFERVAEPILAGLFTADAERLSLRMTLPRFLDLEHEHGSVALALRRARAAAGRTSGDGFLSLRSGMAMLVQRLAARLPAGATVTGAPVAAIEPESGTGRWRVRAAGREPFSADALVIACQAYAAAPLLRGLDEALARELERLDYATCVTVQLLYRSESIGRPLDSFGFFVPRTAGSPVLACNYMSVKYPDRAPRGRTLLRVFLGGAGRPDLSTHGDRELVRIAHDAVRDLLRVGERPRFARVDRFPRSMPQFPVGYDETVRRLRERLDRLPGLFLCGGAVGALGLPDCITSGERAAAEAVAFLGAGARSLELAI